MELLSTTKYDPFLPYPFFLLEYHHKRLLDDARTHEWDISLTLDQLRLACEKALTSNDQTLRIRITLSQEGQVSITTSPAKPFTIDPFAVSSFRPGEDPSPYGPIVLLRLDTEPTTSSIYTRTKTTNRAHYESAQSRARTALPDSDVLMYNELHLLTETSIYNIAFFRVTRWVTPHSNTGCLPGVLRGVLLEQGKIFQDEEGELTLGQAKKGEWVLLSNGLQGCRLGKIVGNNVDM